MKKIRAIIFIIAVLLAFSISFIASAAALIQPTADFYIADNAGVLTDETTGHIVLNNDTLYSACGAQIVVVTLETTGSRKTEDYAYELFNKWGVGSAATNNGILVLMAIRNDDYYACMGSGIEQHFSYGDLKDYLDEYLEPDFAKKKYDDGARKLFDALFGKVAETYGISQRVDPSAYSRWISQNPSGTLPAYSPVPNESLPRDWNEPAGGFAGNTSHGGSAAGNEGSNIIGIIIAVVVLFAVISVLGVISNVFRRSRGGFGGGSFFGGFLLGRMFRPSGRGFTRHPPRPRGRNFPPGGGGFGGGLGGGSGSRGSSSSGGFKFGGGFGGGRSGGGGASRGGGVGRSFGGGFGGGGRSGGGFGGGRSGGGGASRGGGAGRGR